MPEFTLERLKNEIVNDPNGIGYKNSAVASDWKGDQAVADLLNDSANGAQIRRRFVRAAEVKESLDLSEFRTYSAADRDYLICLLGVELIDTREAAVFNGLTTLFPAGSSTRATLLGKIRRQGSRAEVLWSEDTVISAGQVGRAFHLI